MRTHWMIHCSHIVALKSMENLEIFITNARTFRFFLNGKPVTNPDSLHIGFGNYQKVLPAAESYLPLSKKLTFYTLIQAGINFNYKQNLVNNFQVGGLTKTFSNQIIFAGLNESAVNAPGVGALMIGVNYEFMPKLYVRVKTNALVNNFISANNRLKNNWLTGHSLTLAYDSPVGPLEFSVMYCDQARKLQSYINIGIPF